MSWIDPDPSQPAPLSTDFTRLLRDIRVSAVSFTDPAADALIDAMRGIFHNGGVFFGCFTMTTNPTLDWLLSHDRLETVLDRASIVQSDTVFEAFPKLIKEPRILNEPQWHLEPSLTFAGELALRLKSGGAYKSVATLRALQLAEDFRQCLFQQRYDDVLIVETETAWNGWFCNIAWDQSWLILDKRLQRFFLLMATDTD
jgi:hypothetical protein